MASHVTGSEVASLTRLLEAAGAPEAATVWTERIAESNAVMGRQLERGAGA